jgi:hypothetical protein
MKIALIGAALLTLSGVADAHEVWVERDGAGPVRIYLGEPAEVAPAGGDPEFANLKAPTVLGRKATSLVRKTGYLETTAAAGDVRVWDDNVFAPWGDAGKQEGVIYYARAGRTEPRAKLPFEIVPASRGSDQFIVKRDGRPVPGAKVTIVSPARVSTEVVADAKGAFDQRFGLSGRYLLSASAKDVGEHKLPRGTVTTVHRITTTTFVVP